MKKFFVVLVILISALNAKAAAEAAMSIAEINARLAQIQAEMATETDPAKLIALADEATRLGELATQDAAASAPVVAPAQIETHIVTAEKLGAGVQSISVLGSFSKIRVTALDNDIDFDNAGTIDVIESGSCRVRSFQVVHLDKGESQEFDLGQSYFSRFSGHMEWSATMDINEIRFEISSSHLIGSRGRLQIDLIP